MFQISVGKLTNTSKHVCVQIKEKEPSSQMGKGLERSVASTYRAKRPVNEWRKDHRAEIHELTERPKPIAAPVSEHPC